MEDWADEKYLPPIAPPPGGFLLHVFGHRRKLECVRRWERLLADHTDVSAASSPVLGVTVEKGSVPCTIAGSALVGRLHTSALFRDAADEAAVLMPFVTETIAAGERLVLIVDPAERAAQRRRLEDAGVDFERLVASKQLLMLDWNDAYMRSGRFDGSLVLDLLRTLSAETEMPSPPRMRFVGYMDWVTDSRSGIDALLEYERLANDFLEETGSPALCIYRTDRFDRKTLVDVVRTHPTVVVGRQVQQNHFFPFLVPTHELLAAFNDSRVPRAGH